MSENGKWLSLLINGGDMTKQWKQLLKRSQFLVRLVRSLRQAWVSWRETPHLLPQEQAEQQMRQRRLPIIADYLHTHPIPKLQIGVGIYPQEGWLNSDLEPTSPDIIFLDATEPLPFADETFAYACSEHMIEHITYPQCQALLAELYRVLLPHGKVRLATPDLMAVTGITRSQDDPLTREYITFYTHEILGLYTPGWNRFQQHELAWAIEATHMQHYFPVTADDSACFVVNLLFQGFGHRFLYDYHTLATTLMAAGFTEIGRFAPGVSYDPCLCGVEVHGRCLGEALNQYETLVVEGTKS